LESKQLVIIGAGPGGYAAAFLAADLGMNVTLIDKESNPGGVCLYRGCIPSKALLHAAELMNAAEEASAFGIEFGKPDIDLGKLRSWKNDVVKKLTTGLGQLTKQRKIEYVQGKAKFLSNRKIEVATVDGTKTHIEFEHAIIATGSRVAELPGLDLKSDKLIDSTSALELKDIPETMLVIGGGYIGLELGTVYAALGTRITVVEMLPRILSGADVDLTAVLQKSLSRKFEAIMTDTKVNSILESNGKLKVRFERKNGENLETDYDKVLVSIGRKPDTASLGLENTDIELDARGFVKTDVSKRTSVSAIFAIGDIAGEPMIAHKASHEGRVAVEVIHGLKAAFEPKAIPAVVFTDPEIAWAGLTEIEAKAQAIEYSVSKFPWAASGRALTLGRTDGLTKIIIDPGTERILGIGIAGPRAGDMISEGVLAIEMGANATDLKLTIHPHPTLSETIMESAEMFFGQSTHIYRPKK
jgi:dihydrolipoamide dehydrogenase